MSTIGSLQTIILLISICITPFIINPYSYDTLSSGKIIFLFVSQLVLFLLYFLHSIIDRKHTRTHLTILDVSIFTFTVAIAVSTLFSPSHLLSNMFTPYGITWYIAPLFLYLVVRITQITSNHFKLIVVAAILTILLPSITSIYLSSKVQNRNSVPTYSQAVEPFSSAPFITSWTLAPSAISNKANAITGEGVGNYNAFFNRVKPTEINMSPLWDKYIITSGSYMPHVLTEMGLFGLFAYMSTYVSYFWLLKKTVELKKTKVTLFLLLGGFYTLASSIFQPPLFNTLLLFSLLGGFLSNTYGEYLRLSDDTPKGIYFPKFVASLLALLLIVIISFFSFFSIKSLIGEYYYIKAAENLANNKASLVYELQKKSIEKNPYNDQYHRTFSQINLLLANNIVQTKKDTLSQQETQTITQALNQAISESKTAVALNSQKTINWENLGSIYRNIGPLVKDSASWSYASYEEAVRRDPKNPQLYVALGGLNYEQKKYPQAIEMFKKSIFLKSDFANGYYNLAWSYFENKQTDLAIQAMEKAISLLPINSTERTKAQKELDEFRKSI